MCVWGGSHSLETKINNIRPLPDGGERLQCIDFTLRNGGKMPLISAYLPSSSSKDSILEYHEPNCMKFLKNIRILKP